MARTKSGPAGLAALLTRAAAILTAHGGRAIDEGNWRTDAERLAREITAALADGPTRGPKRRTAGPRHRDAAPSAGAGLADVFAYYARTAPLGDLAFYLAQSDAPDIRAQWTDRTAAIVDEMTAYARTLVSGGGSTAQHKRAVWALIDRYKASRAPAIYQPIAWADGELDELDAANTLTWAAERRAAETDAIRLAGLSYETDAVAAWTADHPDERPADVTTTFVVDAANVIPDAADEPDEPDEPGAIDDPEAGQDIDDAADAAPRLTVS